jgi:predicted P-loop ATPase
MTIIYMRGGSDSFLEDSTGDRRFTVLPDTSGMNRRQRRQAERSSRLADRPRRTPRQIIANAVDVVKNRAARLTDAERDRMLAPAREGFTALRQGVASHDQWCGVASAVTMALAIEAQGVVKGMREHFQAAERALEAIWTRAQAGADDGAWARPTLYFDEIAALREAIHLHDFQLRQLAVSELHAAIAITRRNVRAAGGREIPAPAHSIPLPTQERLV